MEILIRGPGAEGGKKMVAAFIAHELGIMGCNVRGENGPIDDNLALQAWMVLDKVGDIVIKIE